MNEMKSPTMEEMMSASQPYDKEEGIPIYTITNANILTNNKPSNGHLKTLALGLKETYNLINYKLSNKKIAEYLIEKSGIKGNFSTDELISIIESATSSNNRPKG
ncbi:MAG: hypothetical protein AB1480_07640 [Nitrospirota bacterium]